MLDFLFITSPTNARNPHPPYYFMSLAAYLRGKGLKVKIIDVKGEDRSRDIEKHLDVIRFALKMNWSRFVGLAAFHSDYPMVMRLGDMIKEMQPDTTLLVGNAHGTIDPQDFIYPESPFNIAVLGEGEETCWELWDRAIRMQKEKEPVRLEEIKGIAYTSYTLKEPEYVKTEPRPFMDLNHLPMPAYDLINLEPYLNPQKLIIRRIYTSIMPIFAGRGCPYHCLRGNTEIETTEGTFEIKDLIGRRPKVLTRDPKTGKIVYGQARSVFKTRTNAELVRIHFQEGMHIDCTPDHRFKAVKYGNQWVARQEWEIEAQNLKAGQSVVACHTSKGLAEARPMMERILGRKLNKGEQVHHLDKNTDNNCLSNLRAVENRKEHLSYHPDFSKMMIENNPSIRLSFIAKRNKAEKISKARKGKPLSAIHRERLSEVKKGRRLTEEHKKAIGKSLKGREITWADKIKKSLNLNNPNKGRKFTNEHKKKLTESKKKYWASKKEIGNHKVLRVEKLPWREDVYCMELPGYDWFFANDILVHNCDFCAANTVWKANTGKIARLRPVEKVLEEIAFLKNEYGIDFFYMFDDTFGMSKDWMEDWFIEKLSYYETKDLPYACQTRANLIDEEMIKNLKETGCVQVDIGVESGSQQLLDRVNKQITIRQIRQAVEWCRKYKIRCFFTMLLNLPGESKEHLQETYRLLKELKPSAGVIFGITTPYPGTKIYTDHCHPALSREEYGLLIGNRLDPLDRFRMSEHSLNLEKLWDKWNRRFKATPMFERMWCLRPFQPLYWKTVFHSERFWSYAWCWMKDLPKTFIIYWLHVLGVYRLFKRVQYGGKGKGI